LVEGTGTAVVGASLPTESFVVRLDSPAQIAFGAFSR